MTITPSHFRDRHEAGRRLADKLVAYAKRPDVLVLALPRGGVPVAYEVARSLQAPLDVFLVRKLGVPGYEELAMGAVATGGVRVLNDEIVNGLRIPDDVVDAVTAWQQQELARRGPSAPPEDSPMARIPDSTVAEAVGKTADPLDELVPDYTPLMRLIGDARFPLLGEASHGTHEFYRERARITKRLIEQHDVLAVAIEGDWPAAARVNRYVRGAGHDAHADDALADFRRFPTWMWRNTEVVEFVEWLRLHNEALPPDAPRVGFYGLDLYSLRASMEAVLRYLEKTDPAVAERARTRYACFDRFGDDPRTYGFL